jgi:hypothetical protein
MVSSAGSTPGDSGSFSAKISADGRFVAFRSYAGNLLAGASGLDDILVRDMSQPSAFVRVGDSAFVSSINTTGTPH